MNRRKFLQYLGLGALSAPVKASEDPYPFKVLAKQMRKTVEIQEQQVLNNYLTDSDNWYIKDDPKMIWHKTGWVDNRGIFGSNA